MLCGLIRGEPTTAFQDRVHRRVGIACVECPRRPYSLDSLQTSASSLCDTSFVMKGETGERWRKLCEQAAVEQESEKLLELAKEINRLLDEKAERLKSGSKPSGAVQ